MDFEDTLKNTQIDNKTINLVKELFNEENIKLIKNKEDIINLTRLLGKKYKVIPSTSKILSIYKTLFSNDSNNPVIENLLKTKVIRSLSGVVVITSFLSPYPETSKGIQKFSCKYDCHYCPKEPGQPRSYLLNEPGVLRANDNKFISTDQFWSRSRSYINMGHPLDKIELIISGGTFNSYPREYITNFIRDQYYAANVAYDKIAGKEIRKQLLLQEEQDINMNESLVKIIGLTIETRPDCVNHEELIYFRELGVTRVQIGVQHIDDRILDHINRKCKNIHTISAIKMLKEAGFKVDIHLMPDLPAPFDITNMVELDRNMFEQVIENPCYQADQWKIYPCATVPWTRIEQWHKEGSYIPYGNTTNEDGTNPLFELLIDIKQKVKPWVRLNRIIRDIPTTYITGGNNNVSMRGDLINYFHKKGLKCNCIRCREVKNKEIDINKFKIKIRNYDASDGIEYFISWEDDNDTLLGFLRLRINSTNNNKYFPELDNCTLIRELHIYGQVINHDMKNKGDGVQHIGLGKQLLNTATKLTLNHGYNKMAVISGVGVRNYYIKQGFEPADYHIFDNILVKSKGHFLIKNINTICKYKNIIIYYSLILLLSIILNMFIFNFSK